MRDERERAGARDCAGRQEKDSALQDRKKIGKKYLICFWVIWAVQMAAAFYFCTRKQGFHEDEYYTYYATARTNGFYVEDGEWMERDVYRSEFVVLPDQRFQYGLVKLVQSWDVHPPVYYWVFHTAASLVPNVFSKWIGLSVNLFFHGINIILLTYLSYIVGKRNIRAALWVTLFSGFGTAAMSGVVFIRMYEMLTTFVLLCAILHVRAQQDTRERLSLPGFLLPMGLVTYLGFLTQYYYFIFLFYLAAAFGLWMLWRDRHIRNCLRYGLCQGLALALACLTYPSCLGQMFRGQRGAQATENFLDLSNTWERIGFFADLMNRYAFGHLFYVFAALAVMLAAAWGILIVAARKGRGEERQIAAAAGPDPGFWMLAFAVAGYFLTVSKTALLLGETSNRYQLPIYGIASLLLFVGIDRLWKMTSAEAKRVDKRKDETGRGDAPRAVTKCIAVVKRVKWIVPALCLLAVAWGYHTEGVVFLYPEDKEQTEQAVQWAAEDVPAVYLYQPGAEWCIWDVANELFAYPGVYFAAADGTDLIRDDRIKGADALVVYVAEGAEEAMQVERILAGSPKLSRGRVMFEEKYCKVYYFD